MSPNAIDWEALLGTDAVGQELEKLYEKMTLESLSAYLGVSTAALRRCLLRCGVKMRPPGGPRFRFPRESLPDDIVNMSTAQIAQLTGYTYGHARKVRRDMRRKNELRDRKGL